MHFQLCFSPVKIGNKSRSILVRMDGSPSKSINPLKIGGNHLSTGGTADGEAEKRRRFGVSLCLELGKRGGVALDRLRHFSVHRVQLHGANHAILLR